MAANASYSVTTYASYVSAAEGGIVVTNINMRWQQWTALPSIFELLLSLCKHRSQNMYFGIRVDYELLHWGWI